MTDEVILISYDVKSILLKFNSLKKEFNNLNFRFIDYTKDSSFDSQITCVPSWILKINNTIDIVSGDVLIKPLRSLIKSKLKENYGKEN